MSAADKELLELAAKAAEIGPLDFDYAEQEGHGLYFGPRLPMPTGVMMAAMHRYWNPLIDDGDALRLAAKLGMDVCLRPSVAYVYADMPNQDVMTDSCYRRAITLAAAEIGRAMP